jgi:hypothetical protein
MSIGQVLLSNTFNEFRITVNDIANTVNGLTANTQTGDIVANTITVDVATANTITANGVNLTFLNASNLGTGTVPDARFPATLPAANGVNLTFLNASNLSTGTVPNARFPATLPTANGVNLTFLNASNLGAGTVPDARFPATLPTANGVNLTFLNASNLGTGTVANARTTANSANGASTIVSRDGAGNFSANTITATTFVGNGSLLTGIAAGGSGLFNTSISQAVGYAITDSMATAYTASSTAGKRYIVHSIHVTNIGAASADVSGQLSGTTYSSISFGDTVPVPVGSSVELLKKPKVLQPSDLIQLQASAASTLHATITIEEVNEAKLFGSGADITSSATYVTLHTATANSVIESVLLSNDDSGALDVKATVVWTNASDTIIGYLAYDLIVPNDATVEVLEQPKFIQNGFKVRVLANQANRLEAIISGKTV